MLTTDAISLFNTAGFIQTTGICPERDNAFEVPTPFVGVPPFIFLNVIGDAFQPFPPLDMCIVVTASILPNNTGNLITYFTEFGVEGYLQVTSSSVTLKLPGTTASFDIDLADGTFKQFQVCTQSTGIATLYVDCIEMSSDSYLPSQVQSSSLDGLSFAGNIFDQNNSLQVSFHMFWCLYVLSVLMGIVYIAVMVMS